MIETFKGDYFFLSNFYPMTFVYGDLKWKTVEHAFQAYKTFDSEQFISVRNAPSPSIAKRIGSGVTLRIDWEHIKVPLMEDLVRRKFVHTKTLVFRLLDTEDEYLVEENTWGDKFWGQCNGVGHNHLGKILMKVREELQREYRRI